MLSRFTPERLGTCFRDLGLQAPAGLFEELRTAYAEPQRAYHTAQHIDECLGTLDLAERNAPVELALWFHDAVYDPRRADNEQRSAAWARAGVLAAGCEEAVAQRVHDLVLATRTHEATGDDPDTRLLLDIDLAILGAAPARFAEYERQVRAEYAHVPQEAFRAGRARILAGFLARERLYATVVFHDALEQRARANLQESLARLQS